MPRPETITESEFSAKINHLKQVLATHGYDRMLLQTEGSMRWLTGLRHQVVDINPNATTTVQALIDTRSSMPEIIFHSEPWEEARVRDIMKSTIFDLCDTRVSYGGPAVLESDTRTLLPNDTRYGEIEREIVSPLVQGLQGNQWEKLLWLVGESRQALMQIGSSLHSGLTGWDVRTRIFQAYHQRHLELNLVMVGLPASRTHLHPVVMDDAPVLDGSIVKLVVGARYADMFHSASQLVKIGLEPPADHEYLVHEALQAAALDYADQFQADVDEATLYESLGPIFSHTAVKYGLPGFERSAYQHHAGGPLSPLGNRDFVIGKTGWRTLLPYAQFSINPVDSLEYLKFELQGVVMPSGPPVVLDEFFWCTDESQYDTRMCCGRLLKLPTILHTGGNQS